MATVNLYLKGALGQKRLEALNKNDKDFLKAELKKEKQIYVKVSVKGDRIEVYTKKRIAQYYWDRGKQEIDTKRLKTEGVELNEWLRDLKTRVTKYVTTEELKGNRVNTGDIQKIVADKNLNKPTSKDFEQYFEQFLSRQKNSEGHSLKPNTLKKYQGFKTHLLAYSNHNFFKLELTSLNADFLADFKDFLTKVQGLSDNTVAKYVKACKTFIRFYMQKGLIPAYDVTVVKSNEKEGDVYVLPIKQVIALQKYELRLESHNRVRDIFCFMCWTGQRFSDIELIRREDFTTNLNGQRIWRFNTQKTGELISVPLIPQALEILEKYKNSDSPLPVISNQKMNQYLKDIGKEIGFDSTARIVRYYDGRKKEEHVPFYEVLTTHIARKSYITNSLILGVPERVVREVSGHKDEKSFRRYVNLAESYKNDSIQNAFSDENLANFM